MPADPSTDQPNSPTAAPASQPVRGQLPWHQPKLTQVSLKITADGSGSGTDGTTSTSSSK